MAEGCFNCGADVGPEDWYYLGSHRVFVCDSQQCQRELRNAEAEERDRAACEAAEDGYARY